MRLMLATIALLFMPFWVTTQSATVPTDFAIHFEFGLCWRDVVDTQNDEYVRDLIIDGATRTVRLGLSDSQRRQLARWVDESRFFELPEELDASTEKDGLITERFPSEKFVMTIQRSGVRRQVRFDDNGDSKSDAVVRVRTLAHRLTRLFTQLPQVKKLPKPPVGCA
jgi:hypothetical protein